MNKIKIIADTSADFTVEEAKAMDIAFVPFTIDAGNATYIDDDTLDLDALYADMQASQEPTRTGCPSPSSTKKPSWPQAPTKSSSSPSHPNSPAATTPLKPPWKK